MPLPQRYRIESRIRKNSQNRYFYLIKEFHVDSKRCIVSKFIRSGTAPTKSEIFDFVRENIADMEQKAGEKYVSVRLENISSRFLPIDTVKKIEHLRYLWKEFSSLADTDELKVYEKNFENQYIHGTTSVEGNTLTYGESENLLEHGIVPAGKELREIFEVQNFKEVVKYRKTVKEKISLSFIKHLHKLIMRNLPGTPGKFRTIDTILISGYDSMLTPSILIDDELTALIAQYYHDIASGYNPFECAVMFHYRFESIHPFSDGNGRVGRELLNYLLIRTGYPRILISSLGRNEYLAALHKGNTDDFSSMVQYFADLLLAQKYEGLKRNVATLFERKLK